MRQILEICKVNQGKIGGLKMKSAFVSVMLLGLLALTLPAQANYSYLAGGADQDQDGDGNLSIVTFSSLAACTSVAAAASNVVQGCFSTCDPANSKSAFYLEQQGDNDNDGRRYMSGVGPYGFLTDCDAAIADAQAAGYTDVQSECMRAQLKKACK
jgi:hypothetical protein